MTLAWVCEEFFELSTKVKSLTMVCRTRKTFLIICDVERSEIILQALCDLFILLPT